MANENYLCNNCGKKFDLLKRIDIGMKLGEKIPELKVLDPDGKDFQQCVFSILNEMWMERKRQVKLWGYEDDDINTRNDWAAYICHCVSSGVYNSKEDGYAEDSFRKNLIKAAAICIAAIEALDRGPLTPTGFEVRENQLNEKRRELEKLRADVLLTKIIGQAEAVKMDIKLNPICAHPEYRMNVGCHACALKNTCQATDDSV